MLKCMIDNSQRCAAVFAGIDAANAADPRTLELEGIRQPYEVVYSQRMTQTMLALYPDASELLLIAARAQHIRRWEIPRASYPLGRQGYENWRVACRENHASLTGAIMSQNGYGSADVARVAMLIKKEQLKRDAQSQALENVVAVVFLAHYLEEFLDGHRSYDDEKIVEILAKTLNKMSPHGHEAALALGLSGRAKRLVEAAVERVADRKLPPKI
jgi:hypothetical protein